MPIRHSNAYQTINYYLGKILYYCNMYDLFFFKFVFLIVVWILYLITQHFIENQSC